MKHKSDIALIGIAVMGENLALNLASKGFQVIVYSRNEETVHQFLSSRAQGKPIRGTSDLNELINDLDKPRKIMLMIKAGEPVDQVIRALIDKLEPGDIIIDGGNSHFEDSTRRMHALSERGILFVGTGVSGGEEGALTGPSIMPGGAKEAWPHLEPIFKKIAAQANDGQVCCEWMGPEGAGHFVKMVHNGIEYGDMQLISEAYHIMKSYLRLSNETMAKLFKAWNQTELESYLIEITADILDFKEDDGSHLIDHILDTAGQKGTGKWTVTASMEQGVPLTLIAESVYARSLSYLKDERILASKAYGHEDVEIPQNQSDFIEALRQALYASKIMSYAQGFALLTAAGNHYSWNMDYGNIAMIWRGGCIIRSTFLDKIKAAYMKSPKLNNLLLDPYFRKTIQESLPSFRKVVATAILNGIPVPAMSSALSYFDSYRSMSLPANLIQAQRDYFGAHTYERVDRKRGEFFHTNWTGRGGKTSSTTYNK